MRWRRPLLCRSVADRVSVKSKITAQSARGYTLRYSDHIGCAGHRIASMLFGTRARRHYLYNCTVMELKRYAQNAAFARTDISEIFVSLIYGGTCASLNQRVAGFLRRLAQATHHTVTIQSPYSHHTVTIWETKHFVLLNKNGLIK